jgi:hypothetical protein
MTRALSMYCTLLLLASLVSPLVRDVPALKTDTNVQAAEFLKSQGLLITGLRTIPNTATLEFSLSSSNCFIGLKLLVLPSPFNIPATVVNFIDTTDWQKQFVFDGSVVSEIGSLTLAPLWLRGKLRLGLGAVSSDFLAFKPLVLLTPPECIQPDLDWTILRRI